MINDSRRSLALSVGTTLLTAITGYLGVDGRASSNAGDDASTETDDPDPTVVGPALPDPSLVWVDDEPVAGERHEFSAEIHNAGGPATVGMTLVWLADRDRVPNAVSTTRRGQFFETDEHKQLSVLARVPGAYDAYDLRLWVSEFDVEIENDGGRGRIEVFLLERERVVDETELAVDAGETVSLAFDGRYAGADPADFALEARPVS